MDRPRRTRGGANPASPAASVEVNKSDEATNDFLTNIMVEEDSESLERDVNELDSVGEFYSPPESPFFGFSNADIPQPIVIKTEPVEGISDAEDDECVIVNVTKATVPLPSVIVKKEKEDDDDPDIFYGFSITDLPRPIVIKDEPLEEVSAERADEAVLPDFFLNEPEVPLGPTSNVPGDDLLDEFELNTPAPARPPPVPSFVVINHSKQAVAPLQPQVAEPTVTTANLKTTDLTKSPKHLIVKSPVAISRVQQIPVLSPEPEKQKPTKLQTPVLVEQDLLPVPGLPQVHTKLIKSPSHAQSSQGKSVQVLTAQKELQLGPNQLNKGNAYNPSGQHVFVSSKPENQKKIEKFRLSQDGENFETIQQIQLLEDEDIEQGQSGQPLPKNIQIIDQNGEKIVIMDQDAADEDYDTDCEEDREFTVIVEEDDDDRDEESMNRDIHIDENNVIEADSIEDILAQFESESAAPRSVSCPNCRKCFVSSHFLNLHISNNSTMCDLCNTQCCSQVNLRNHKNLECDLSKRKRNIDLIAQETAILGRKPIEPEKYYNMPIESDEEMEEEDMTPTPTMSFKKLKSINDAKYECGLCGRYVKILDSHMKFVHGLEGGARGSKYRCPECSVLVSDLESHVERRHGENAEKMIVGGEDDSIGEIVRCRHPGCDLFFNNGEEVAEHIKREHTDEVRLACGMGGCDEVFDNRGALKRHRTDSHPELDEFKPVDLEPDDPDRAQDLTVACPVCERKFKHKNTCTVHIKTNHLGWTKRKLFECPDCFRAFDNKKAVDSHREAVHLGIRTVCPLCEKPVTRLDLHVRMVHTELPEWPCPDCGKKFKRKFDLNRHRVTVHLGVRNFPCDLCGKRFADMKDMTRHKNAVHYGMKIKWNSRKNKEKSGRMRGAGRPPRDGGLKREDTEEKEFRRSRQSAEVKMEDGSVSIPVEYIETVETSGEEIAIGRGGLEGSTVILDPVLQSQLGARVHIEADPENSGGLRFVVIQDEETGSILSGGDTVEVR